MRKEKYLLKKKGSVTVFVCLFLVVFLGLMQIFFRMVQIAGGRVQAIAGVQEGLYSVFAGYDRDMFDKYHLFFVDGTYATENLNLGEAFHRIQEKVMRNCSSSIVEFGVRRENVWNCYYERGEITGYTLATDNNGQSFKKQAIGYMKDTLGIQGIQLLLEQSQKEEKWSLTEDGNVYVEDGKKAQKDYEVEIQKQENAISQSVKIENISKDFKNPLDVIKEIRKKGILSLVMPLSTEVSEAEVIIDNLPSARNLESGITVQEEGSDDILDNLLFQEYIMRHMSCYRDSLGNSSASTGLVYELEYILAGKSSDIDNLKTVVTKLIGMREAANIAYLMNNPMRQAELHQMSLLICTAIGLPAIEGVVSLALAAAWSFGESVLDVKQLLAGGKVPLVKTEDTWQLSLESLCELTEILKENPELEQRGLSYEQYLKILLGIQNTEQQVNRTMDIVENKIRAMEGRENFRIDCCLSYMEVKVYVNCNGLVYEILRDYGYEM